MQTFEVGHFRRVACLNERFETGLDQLDSTATQNSLLTEQVGFGLILERSFDDAGTTAAHTAGVGQRNVLGIAGRVLEDRDQVRNTAALDELRAHSMARRFRCDHDDVKVSTRNDLVVVDSKAVSEGQGSALLQVGLNLGLVQLRLEFVRGQDHDNVSCCNSGRHIADLQAMGLSLGDGAGTRTQANSYIDAGVFQVAGVRVALRTVADDGNFLALDDAQITIFIVIDLHEIPLLTERAIWPATH